MVRVRPSAGPRRRPAALIAASVAVLGFGVAIAVPAMADPGPLAPTAARALVPGNLLVSTSTYENDPNLVVGTPLPPGCGTNSYNSPCVSAVANGSYPYVFNNASVDPSFGVTSKIVLQQLSPSGAMLGSIEVPNSTDPGVGASSDQMVTSFSSKSELALNLSTGGDYVTFVGYEAPVATPDVSNANTPGDVDPTNPVVGSYPRVVAQLGANGRFTFTKTNAFSGDNGRAAILNDEAGADLYYAAGNAGNGANPEPQGVVTGAGAQLIQPSTLPESAQTPGQPTPLGNFNVTELGDKADKTAKDNNYRGLAAYGNVLYYTKGSGSNGVDTVYFVDTSGTACPAGTGLPAAGASLPTASTVTYSTSSSALGLTTANPGLTPTNMCILKGFPTGLAKSATDASDYPFGLWFANPDTLYVADEGAGDNTYSATTGGPSGEYTAAAASTTAGLQKWVYNSTAGDWQLAYTLQSGLNLGQPYTVPGYPTGLNSGPGGTGLPWAPATDGLRNLTGQVNSNGTVTIWAATSTVSGGGDQGADPNKLVSITDNLGATSLPASESFQTTEGASSGSVIRGVSFTPKTVGPTLYVSNSPGVVPATAPLGAGNQSHRTQPAPPGTAQDCANSGFPTISSAVAAATPGETIIVCPGVYKEDVVVPSYKPLTIEGVGRPILDAAGLTNGIQVLASASTVEGLTVADALGEGILVGGTAPVSGVTIEDNTVIDNDQGNPTGASITSSSYAECNSSAAGPGDCGEGIHLLSADNSVVTDNVVSGNSGGILLSDEVGPTDGNLISDNHVTDNAYDCGITLAGHHNGVFNGTTWATVAPAVGGVYDNTVRDNVVANNGVLGQGGGVLLATGNPGGAVNNNLVEGNTLSGNGLAGVTVHSHSPGENLSGNVISGNTIGTNNLDGDPDFAVVDPSTTGVIVATAASPITITIENNLIENDLYGIWTTGSVSATTGPPANKFVGVTTPIAS